MNILDALTGNINYVELVKSYILKVFKHEARKYQTEPHKLMIIIDLDEQGVMKIMTYDKPDNKTWRVIPDEEVQKILMK
jgi:hypothetical protein